MSKQSVLFVCIHNSARSQMAEAFLQKEAGDWFEVESAGIEPGTLNSVVVEAMKEVGINISGNTTQSVSALLETGRTFDYVITVCDEANAERCPVFSGEGKRLHWGFPDPSAFGGATDEKLTLTRRVRDQIHEKIKTFCAERI